MRLAILALSGIATLLALNPGAALADDLPRRGDLGAAIAPPAEGKGARIVRFRPNSALEAAGAAVGDEIIGVSTARAPRVPGDPAADGDAFAAFVRALRAGDAITLR